ncbi:unnamed protein product [Prorocentrum cordatum]|uniref:Secreted peptide n=1 Tax=Prorocentrum cordatum TaxID=2364126 RepID=A0ABN9RQ97_9DINO|nr:unnamed protein product [Polarella glacialis]
MVVNRCVFGFLLVWIVRPKRDLMLMIGVATEGPMTMVTIVLAVAVAVVLTFLPPLLILGSTLGATHGLRLRLKAVAVVHAKPQDDMVMAMRHRWQTVQLCICCRRFRLSRSTRRRQSPFQMLPTLCIRMLVVTMIVNKNVLSLSFVPLVASLAQALVTQMVCLIVLVRT